MTHALDLIARLAAAEAALAGQPFMAPLLGGRVRLRVQGLVYELRVRGAAPGWWVCQIRDPRRARVVGPAEPWQRDAYLARWPLLRMVLVEPLRPQSGAPADWLALPLSPSDAAQRFGLRGPVALRLVEGGQPLERVLARVEGATLWFDAPDMRADPLIAERLRAALHARSTVPPVAGLAAGEQAAYLLLHSRQAELERAAVARQLDQRLRHALLIGGAQLIGYEPFESGWRIVWERAGERHISIVSAGLDIISAGVCLSGQDGQFDLASIVGVVAEAPDFAR